MAWVDRRITTAQLARHWVLVCLANLAGALGTAVLMHWSGALLLGKRWRWGTCRCGSGPSPTLVPVMVVMNVEVLMLQGRMLVLEDRGIGGRP